FCRFILRNALFCSGILTLPLSFLLHQMKMVHLLSGGPRTTVATPLAKKLAKQHKLNFELWWEQGHMRITPADIEAEAGIFSSKKNVGPAVVAQATPAAPPKPATAAPF
ncbi:Dihydrolipoyllysine-residue acetyltransferase component of pyruvate dehydrogenase complex, partial [Corchorus capsularis]